MTKTYDSKCYELAEHFLDEEFSSRPDFKALCHKLAQQVQQTVEDFYAEHYDPTPWCAACGARSKEACKCGPIADNE